MNNNRNKYYTIFDTLDDYFEYYLSDDFKEPNVSLISDSNRIIYEDDFLTKITVTKTDASIPSQIYTIFQTAQEPCLYESDTENLSYTFIIKTPRRLYFGPEYTYENVTSSTGITNHNAIKSIKFDNFAENYSATMRDMFLRCSNLEYINFTDFDLSKISDWFRTFGFCTSLKNVYFNSIVNPTKTTSMFEGCSSITNINLSKFSMTNNTDATAMFKNASELRTVSGLNNNWRSLTSSKEMFEGTKLESVPDFSEWHLDSIVDMTSMFKDSSISNDPGFGKISNSTIVSLASACENTQIPSADLSDMNGACPNLTSVSRLFARCSKLETVSWFDKENSISDYSSLFDGCSALKETCTISTHFDSATNHEKMFADCSTLKNVVLNGTGSSWNPTNFGSMFAGDTSLESISFTGLSSVANVSNWEYFSNNCSNLRSISGLPTAENTGFSTSVTFDISSELSHESILNILNCAIATPNTNTKNLIFAKNISISSENKDEIMSLISACESKGWTVYGLVMPS